MSIFVCNQWECILIYRLLSIYFTRTQFYVRYFIFSKLIWGLTVTVKKHINIHLDKNFVDFDPFNKICIIIHDIALFKGLLSNYHIL